MTRGFRYYYGARANWQPHPRIRYVKTGEKRPPRAGELFLSGAVPEVYQADSGLTESYHIMRVATREETHCKCCGQLLPTTE